MVEEDEEGQQAFPLNSFQAEPETEQAFSESSCLTPFLGWLALEMHLPSLTKCQHHVFANNTRHVSYDRSAAVVTILLTRHKLSTSNEI